MRDDQAEAIGIGSDVRRTTQRVIGERLGIGSRRGDRYELADVLGRGGFAIAVCSRTFGLLARGDAGNSVVCEAGNLALGVGSFLQLAGRIVLVLPLSHVRVMAPLLEPDGVVGI